MLPCLRPGALATAAVLGLAASASAQGAYNMIEHARITTYTGINDCWGYTSPGGVELAIYGHQSGTSFVDATDLQNPVEVFNLPGPTSTWRDIKTYQNHAYIVTEGAQAGTGLQIVDLADPLNPVHVTTYTADSFTTAHNIWIDEPTGIAYACGANLGGMHVLDLTNPTAPVEVSFFNQYYIHDLYVGDGRGYAGAFNTGSLRILDVTNPSNLTTIGSHFYNGAATHNAWPHSSGSWVATSDETNGGHMQIWDISNLSNITFTSEYFPSSDVAIIHNILIEDDLAFISHYKSGARVVDVTDPANPVEVGFYDTHPGQGGAFDGNWGIYPFRSDHVVYASDRQFGFFVLEFTGDYAGQISGNVTDSNDASGVSGATVDLGGPAVFLVDGAGGYGGFASGGPYDIVTSAFGYTPDTSSVTVPTGGSVVHDVVLQAQPVGTVELHVVESGTSTPVVGARIDVLDTPVVGNVTDAGGVVALPLPAQQTWAVQVAKFGHALTVENVVPVAGTTTQVTVEVPRGFHDDFDIDQAWIVGAGDDTATDGVWERAVPVASSFLGPVGADTDATPTGAGFAFVTENHVGGAFVGSSDVDNGKTTLLTPVFDASGLGTLTLNYQRWFSNRAPNPDNDEFRADVSTDGGSSWTNLETVAVGTDAWAAVSIDLTALVPATATMQLRFVAEDINSTTYVEAGLDDVEILSGATDAPLIAAGAPGLEMAAPAPNPFRDGTRLSFRLPEAGPASVEIHDVSGRRVAVLLEGRRIAAGSHQVSWDGTDDNGRRVAPGVYFASLRAAGETAARKLVRMR